MTPPPLPAPYIVFINSLAVKGYEKGKTEDHTKRHETTRNDKILTEGRRDNDLFHVAHCLIKNRTPVEEVSQYLEILAENSDPPFPLKEIPEKIQSALKRVERRERNIAQEVREWVETTRGYFETTLIDRELHLTTKDEMGAANVALRRLVEEGILEKYGDKRGAYRRVEAECEDIDFLNASTASIDISWPFDLQKYINTLPKNIVVVAGEPDAGKTAFLLNVVRLNMNRHPINYFNSEMGPSELKSRLSKFDIPLKDWKFKAKERSFNFADVVSSR